jgi:hypothetical protein
LLVCDLVVRTMTVAKPEMPFDFASALKQILPSLLIVIFDSLRELAKAV